MTRRRLVGWQGSARVPVQPGADPRLRRAAAAVAGADQLKDPLRYDENGKLEVGLGAGLGLSGDKGEAQVLTDPENPVQLTTGSPKRVTLLIDQESGEVVMLAGRPHYRSRPRLVDIRTPNTGQRNGADLVRSMLSEARATRLGLDAEIATTTARAARARVQQQLDGYAVAVSTAGYLDMVLGGLVFSAAVGLVLPFDVQVTFMSAVVGAASTADFSVMAGGVAVPGATLSLVADTTEAAEVPAGATVTAGTPIALSVTAGAALVAAKVSVVLERI
jgi:hypothetical protein